MVAARSKKYCQKKPPPYRAGALFRVKGHRYDHCRRRGHRCSAHVTAKLTAAPMAASTAVLTMSCMPSWVTTLSRVPPLVPTPSWKLVVFIGFSFLVAVAQAAFHRLQHAHCRGEVLGQHHHLGWQLQRRGDDELAGYGLRFLDPVVKCRFSRLRTADCFCCFIHCF